MDSIVLVTKQTIGAYKLFHSILVVLYHKEDEEKVVQVALTIRNASRSPILQQHNVDM